jgi:hypothetical protein
MASFFFKLSLFLSNMVRRRVRDDEIDLSKMLAMKIYHIFVPETVIANNLCQYKRKQKWYK